MLQQERRLISSMCPHLFKLILILTFKSSEIDTSFYILTVDLWNAEGTHKVNLIQHSGTSPSISAAVSSSYPPPLRTLSFSYPAYPQPSNLPAQPAADSLHYCTESNHSPQAGLQYAHGGLQTYHASMTQGYYPLSTPTQVA